MKRSRTTTTRVIRPAATRPRASVTETRNVSRRPSTLSSVASAVTSARPGSARGARAGPRSRPTSCRDRAPADGLHARLLDQGDEARGGQHRYVAAPDRERGVSLFDRERDRRGETGRNRHPLTIGSPAPSSACWRADPATPRPDIAHETHEADMTVPLIEHDVLQATLDHALRSGGDFAEVFVEDRRSSTRPFRRRPRRRARLRTATAAPGCASSAATRRASRTPPISRPAGLRASRRSGGRRRSWRRWRTEHRRAGAAGDAPARRATRACPDTVEKRRKVELLAAGRRRRPRRRQLRHVGDRVVRRRPPPHPRRQLRRPAGRRRPGAHADVGAVRRDRRHRHADRLRGARPHDGLRALRRRSPPKTSAARAADRALTLLDAVPAPSRPASRRAEAGRGRRAVPRGVRARARSRPHPEGRVGVQGSDGPAGRVAARHPRRRRRLRPRVGHARDRRRRSSPRSATC